MSIIMVSAKKDDIDKYPGLELGADDYMTKPFSPSELVARVKAHLARYERLIGSNVEENQIIEIRGLKIDTTARRVRVKGGCLFMTKEFDLLTFLAGHPNHVYTKEELFRRILGYGVDRGYRDGYGTYQKDPREDRVRDVASAVYRDNMGSGIPV